MTTNPAPANSIWRFTRFRSESSALPATAELIIVTPKMISKITAPINQKSKCRQVAARFILRIPSYFLLSTFCSAKNG
jgi:hypothetical protein